MAMLPSSLCKLAIMRAKELIGLAIAPPYNPECKSCDGPFNFASTYTRPRSMVVIAGVSMSHIPVSLTMATSHSNSLAYSRRNGSKLSLPDSSSPSKRTVTGQGGPPAHSCQARNASKNVITCPLSSTAPRATTRLPIGPLMITGSNGGLVHNSIGSAGCTS